MIDARDRAAARPMRVAVPKGALFKDCVEVLADAGLPTDGLADPGRQLIVRCEDVEYIISRPTDIPSYVAYGAADCGVAGKDVLIEAGLDVIELVDLEFGECRFVVAEAQDAGDSVEERRQHLGVVRVATKYPNVTQAYFDRMGTQAEIVKLHGNIELAPLIGLADQVVDITATGTTLRENRLQVVGEVLESTARFIGNPAAVRTDSRVLKLADALSESVAKLGEAVRS